MKSYRVTPNISQNECFFLALWEIFFNMNKQNKSNKFWSDGSSQKKTVQLYNLVLLHRMLYVNYSSWNIRIMSCNVQIHTYVNVQLYVGALVHWCICTHICKCTTLCWCNGRQLFTSWIIGTSIKWDEGCWRSILFYNNNNQIIMNIYKLDI